MNISTLHTTQSTKVRITIRSSALLATSTQRNASIRLRRYSDGNIFAKRTDRLPLHAHQKGDTVHVDVLSVAQPGHMFYRRTISYEYTQHTRENGLCLVCDVIIAPYKC